MKNFAKVNTVLLILVLIMSVAICFLIARNLPSAANPAAAGGIGWDAKKQLDFAETLATKGLKKEALAAFDDYLKIAKLSAMEAAKLLYRMGNMYMELLDYEKALYYFYKAEAADPNVGFKSELDEKLVECLQRLNMTGQAKYELAARTSLGPELPQEPGGVVLAKVGNKEITEKEIDDAISEMPDWAKESFSQGEGKAEFVRQYATTQALYEKAKRMGLEQDVEVRRTIRDITKQLLVKRLLEKELNEKISADLSDMEAYYEANKDMYRQQAAAGLSIIKFSESRNAQDALRRLSVGADFSKMAQELSEDEDTKANGGAIDGDAGKDGYIPGVGASKEATDAIFSKKEGEITGPFKIGDAFYIFKINSITPERRKSFQEVKEQVEYEYRNKKVQEQIEILLTDIMQQERVEIYTDRILKESEEEKNEKAQNSN